MANEQESQFRLRLNDEVTGAADTARGALTELRDAMEADTKSLTALNKAMSRMKAAGVSTGQQFLQVKEAIEQKKKALAGAQAEYFNLGGSVGSLSKKTPQLTSAFAQFIQQAQRMRGPLGALAQGFAKLSAFVVANKMKVGLLAIAAGVAYLGVATARAVRTLYQYATAQANARRSELLRLEGLSKIRTYMTMAYGLKATDPRQMQASIDRVSASVSINRGEVERWNEQLYKAGLRGRQLDLALEGVSITAAAQGSEQANLFASWAQGYALTGRSVEGLTNRVKSRLGGIVKAQMLDSEVQAVKLQESFGAMFRGLDTEALLKAKAEFNALFSQSTASGRALSRLLTNVVRVMADGMTLWQRLLTTAVEIGVVGLLKLENIVLRLRLGWELLGLGARNAFKKIVLDARDMALGVKNAVLELAKAVTDTLKKATGSLLGQLDKPFHEMNVGIQIAISSLGAFAAKLTITAYPAMVAFTRHIVTVTIPAVAAFARRLIFTTIPALLQMARTFVTTTLPAVARFAWALVLQAGPAILTFARSLVTTAVPALITYARWAGAAALRTLAVVWPVALAVLAFWGLIKVIELVYTIWKEIDWKDLGRSVLKGIGEGMMSVGSWLYEQMSAVADKLKTTFANALGIKSPSKVFAELGRGIPAGLELGIKQGTGGVAVAVESMLAATPGAAPSGQGAAGSQPSAAASAVARGGNTASVSIKEIHIHMDGGSQSQARDAALSVRAELERILQGVAFELGADPV